MDENTLIEIIKSGLNAANSSLSAVVGAVITTLFLSKNTKISEFEKVKAGKFNEVIDCLLESGKMSYLEYYKCNNFLDIAKKADSLLAHTIISGQKEQCHCGEYDFDWFIRFFDAASNISNEEMKRLWASVLAGEVYQSGSFSLRAIDTLYNMTPYEAELFSTVSKIIIDNSKVFSSMGKVGQQINEKYQFDNDALRLLEECGVLNGLRMDSQLELLPGESGGFTCGNNLLLFQPAREEKIVIDYTCYTLTMVGLQLYPVVYSGADDTYLVELGKAIQENFPSLKVSLHPMTGEDDDCISYDAQIDLLNK